MRENVQHLIQRQRLLREAAKSELPGEDEHHHQLQHQESERNTSVRGGSPACGSGALQVGHHVINWPSGKLPWNIQNNCQKLLFYSLTIFWEKWQFLAIFAFTIWNFFHFFKNSNGLFCNFWQFLMLFRASRTTCF